MRRAVFSAIFAAIGAAAACGSFDESPDQPGTPDAASDGGGDTSSGGDAQATDANDKDGGVSTARCIGQDLIALDGFDRIGAAGSGWSPSGPVPDIDPDFGLKPPSLKVESDALGIDAGVSKLITRTVGVSTNAAVCVEFDLYYEQPSGTFTDGSFAEILQIGYGVSHVYVEETADGFSFSTDAKTANFEPFTKGAWHHLTLRLPFTTGSVSLQVDETRKPIDLPLGPAPPNLVFELGLQANGMAGATGAVRVHVDNFHVTSE